MNTEDIKRAYRWVEEAVAALNRAGYTKLVDEEGESDYQGWVCLLAQNDSGEYAVISWSYGSCSGCDEYENMPDAAIEDAFDSLVETCGADESKARKLFSDRRGW